MSAMKRLTKKLAESARLAQALGAGPMTRLRLFALAWWFPLRRWLRLPAGPGAVLLLQNHGGATFRFRVKDSTDIAVLYEAFVDEEYRINLPREPEIVFDLGSNIGASVIYFRLKYPRAHIYAFEPNPATFGRLVEHARQFSDITTYPYALSDADGPMDFFVHPESHLSSSAVRRTSGQKPITVEARTLNSAMAAAQVDRIDLLKFDIEGGEARLFKDAPALAKVGATIGEVHLDLMNETKESFAQLLSEFELTERPIKPTRYVVIAYRKK